MTVSANVTVADAVIVTVTVISLWHHRDREAGHERKSDMNVTLKVTISRLFMSDSHGQYISLNSIIKI